MSPKSHLAAKCQKMPKQQLNFELPYYSNVKFECSFFSCSSSSSEGKSNPGETYPSSSDGGGKRQVRERRPAKRKYEGKQPKQGTVLTNSFAGTIPSDSIVLAERKGQFLVLRHVCGRHAVSGPCADLKIYYILLQACLPRGRTQARHIRHHQVGEGQVQQRQPVQGEYQEGQLKQGAGY